MLHGCYIRISPWLATAGRRSHVPTVGLYRLSPHTRSAIADQLPSASRRASFRCTSVQVRAVRST